jgi:hypothetical protein
VTAAFGGRILDTSAILNVATGASVYGRALRDTALGEGMTLSVPAAALAAAWAAAGPLGRLFLDQLLDVPVVVVDPLDGPAARTVGVVLAFPSVPGSYTLDQGHVVAVARGRGWPIISADPTWLLRLEPNVDVEPLP